MKVQACLLAAVLAIEGGLAHPALHHAHKALHLRDVLARRGQDWHLEDVNWSEALKGVDFSKIHYNLGGGGSGASASAQASTQQKSSSPPVVEEKKTESQPAKKPSGGSQSKKPSGGSGSCLNVVDLKKRVTPQEVGYVGDVVNNIIPETDCSSSGQYSITFVNNRGEKKGYQIWNKIVNGQPMGMMSPPAKSFELENGQKATFTFAPNSQIGFSEDCGRAATNGGVPNCNVGEANFEDHNTGGGSAYDVSMVTFNDIKSAGGSPVYVPMTVNAPGCSDSTNTNCVYTEASQDWPDQAGCKLTAPQGDPFHLQAVFG